MGKLTDKAIKDLKRNPPKKGNAIFWDGELRGLGARITAHGVVSFVLEYRARVKAADGSLVEGAKRRYTIGRHPEWSVEQARTEALKLREGIRNGVDPLEAKDSMRKAPTMEEVCEAYLVSARFQKKRATSQRDDRAMVEKIIVPALGKRRVLEITRKHIDELHGEMKQTPYRANRVVTLLSTIFSFAISDGVASENPTRGVERYPEEKRETWLTVEQMRALDVALRKYGKRNADGANLLRLLILTGARVGEVLQADWHEFDLERAVWTKPSAHTKQKRTASFPLNDPALALLKSMKPKGATGPLFPGTHSRKSKRSIRFGRTGDVARRVSYKRAWTQVCALAGLAEKHEVPSLWVKGRRAGQPRIDKKTGKPIMLTRWRPTVRVHDLRHSYASFLVSNGVPLQVVGSLLGHTQASTTQRYAHAHDDARRAATNKLADILPFAKVG